MFIILFYWALSVTCDSADRPLISWILYFPGFDFTNFSRYFPKHFLKISFLSCLNISIPLDFIFGPQFFSIFYSLWVISIILLVLTLIVWWWSPNLPQSSKVDLNIQLPSLVHHIIRSLGSFFFPSSRQRYVPSPLWSASWAASAWRSTSWTVPHCRPAACHQTASQ